MIDTDKIYNKIIALLDSSGAEYKLFEHRAALTYEELEAVQKEAGFFGTEGKCMVIKADNKFIVYVTTFGKEINFNLIKEKLNVNKISLASPEELKKYFGAEPGCAYPFGFNESFDIFIDPGILILDGFYSILFFRQKPIQSKE